MLKISPDHIRFTDAYVRKLGLPADKSDHIAWDPHLPGFGVRLRPGKASYVVQYRIGTSQRRKSLGDVRKVNLDDARGIARKRFAQVELGIDPDAEEDKRRADQESDARTFEKTVDLYLAAQEARLQNDTLRRNIAELVLNHAGHKSGIGGVYDHHDYQPEITEALRKWEAHLLTIVTVS